MNTDNIKNGDLLRIKSALDGEVVIAIAVTTSSSDATSTEKIVIVDEADGFRASYELSPDAVVDVIGNPSQFFSDRRAQYNRMLNVTDRPIDTLSMVRAVDILYNSKSATDDQSVRVAIEQAKAIGERRVSIFERRIQDLAA